MTPLTVGTSVHLKGMVIEFTGCPSVLRGVAGTVKAVLEDSKGTYYKVETRNGHVRYARREGLTVHRDKKALRAPRAVAYVAVLPVPSVENRFIVADWLAVELPGVE